MRPKYARVITNVFDGSAEYEIYGVDIPLTRETTDEYRLYADHENGCGGDKIVCFSLYTDGLITVEKIAWSASDHAEVLSALNVRFAVKSTMSFMAWFWRGQCQKATTPQPKSTTLDGNLPACSKSDAPRHTIPTATQKPESYEKLITIGKESNIADMWSQLADGITLETKKDGFSVIARRYVNYEEQHIAIMVVLANKEYFLASRVALFRFLKRHDMLNLHWFKA